MEKKAILGIKTAIFIIVAFIMIVGIITISKWPITAKVVDKIQKISGENTLVKLTTSEGDIIIELYPDKAPITVNNFLSYVNSSFYDKTVFHRVISGFMIQGGGFTQDGKEKPTKAPIKLESDNGLKNDKYTIAMARTNDPNSATSQFFINSKNNTFLNYAPGNPGYAVFGKVIEGTDVVDKIEKERTTTKYGMKDWPSKDIVIEKAELLN